MAKTSDAAFAERLPWDEPEPVPAPAPALDASDAGPPIHAPRLARHDPISPQRYEAPAAGRVVGGAGTIAIGALLAAGLLVALDRVERPKAVSTPLVVMALPPAPPAPAPAPAPRPVTQPTPGQPRAAAPQRRMPTPAIVPLPASQIAAATPQRAMANPAPPAPALAPAPQPQSQPAQASPAQPPASHGPDRWEGRVLARIERFRRYPADARHAHVEGTASVRFRIDRDGHVLSAAIERSSGSAVLDQAALDTLRRADPLPKVPADRPDQVELVVPIEFSIRP